ncbi:hypothetical protein [Brucella tritici]|uniref:hypothetical protein n=1 Tax=Brucella tritici TaxID=94626 RepID=UPI001F3C555B|nr:hypothetical protein [Brucella tritici]
MGVVTLSFSGRKGQGLVDIQAKQAAIFHASKLRGDGSELCVRLGDEMEQRNNCGSLSAWRRTVATLQVTDG